MKIERNTPPEWGDDDAGALDFVAHAAVCIAH